VFGTLLALAALLVSVTVVLSANQKSVPVALVGMRASAVQETTSTSNPVGSTAPTTSATPPTPAAADAAPVTVPPPPRPAVTTDCDDALQYLAAHQAPGFTDHCGDGSAFGHYGYACWNVAGTCPNGAKIIHIACPAPFVYMNEAHNSWTLIGEGSGLDPYGQGTPAEQAFCQAHR
jgi:hypothetical protein